MGSLDKRGMPRGMPVGLEVVCEWSMVVVEAVYWTRRGEHRRTPETRYNRVAV